MNKTWATILMIFGMMATMATIGDFNIGGALTSGLLAFAGYYYRNKALLAEANNNHNKFLPQQPKLEINDDFIIRLANRLNKRLSVEDLVSQTTLGREEAKNRLESMSQKGICEIRLDEVQNSGKIYYYFD